jgi:hypothetical protein
VRPTESRPSGYGIELKNVAGVEALFLSAWRGHSFFRLFDPPVLQIAACEDQFQRNTLNSPRTCLTSQSLTDRWFSADYAAKRRILKIICLNFRLGATLVPENEKPFDVLAKGLLVSSSRGDRTPLELFIIAAQRLALDGLLSGLLDSRGNRPPDN